MREHDKLKSLFTKGDFGPAFIEAAKEELPFLWGRMSLLEEFYSGMLLGGLGERGPSLLAQLGRPQRFRPNLVRRVWATIIG